jgi:hypothetical protein
MNLSEQPQPEATIHPSIVLARGSSHAWNYIISNDSTRLMGTQSIGSSGWIIERGSGGSRSQELFLVLLFLGSSTFCGNSYGPSREKLLNTPEVFER